MFRVFPFSKGPMLITADKSGVWSNINKVVTAITQQGPNIDVDWRAPIFPYGRKDEGNIYERFFGGFISRQPPAIRATAWTGHQYTFNNVASFYRSGSKLWRDKLRRAFVTMNLNEELYTLADQHMSLLGLVSGCYDAIQVRFTDHGKEQPNGKVPTIKQYEQELRPGFPLFVASNLQWVCDYFPDARYLDIPRTADSNTDLMYQKRGTLNDVRDAILDVIIMSRARKLIHPVSNMATGALYLNPALESVFLEHDGI